MPRSPRPLRRALPALLLAAPLVISAQRAPRTPAAAASPPAIPVASEFDALHFRSIGPATMSGRIAGLAVNEANPAEFYVATAHGGVWKTTSNGVMWTPLLQHDGLMSTGAVTLSQRNPQLVWVGTGESNNRQSTSWGDGIYKSTDGGTTFTHMGLRASKHIHRIVIDPTDDNVVYVAATGPLFGSGGERGVYKTTDGGTTWKRTLFVDDETGANDLVISPANPRVLFASMYQRRRTACCMNGGGSGSALYTSTDAGDTWRKVEGGFPSGDLGRIAVDIAPSNPNILYALVEAPLQAGAGDQGLWRSDDAGATWRKVNSVNPRPMYFSKIEIDPTNPDRLFYGGVGLHLSVDGGKTVETDAALVTHDDVHAIWVNPRNPLHVLTGNDGGVAVSYDGSRTWQFVPNLPVGLFYHVWYDMATPFNICGGMQDNYNWCGPSRSRFGAGIMNYDWFQILGGDGFHAIPDPRDGRIVYTESQNGNMIRRNTVTGESRSIRPTPQSVSPAVPSNETFRFHWDAPMMLSPHDPGVLLVAAHRVFRSTDRGDSWTVISPDLTGNGNRDTIRTMGVKGSDIRIAKNDGITSWPAVVSLAESPKQAGVIYTGTDDGTVQVTVDGGATWRNITGNIPGFPAGAFVSEVVPSRYDAGTVYVTVDHHRENDYESYVWASTNFGATFTSLRGNLRGEVVRTLAEDTRNANVLYIGTESGLFVSIDRGRSWKRWRSNLPNVRIDELTIHPRDNALIVGSHGRSIWVLDDLAPVQEYAAASRTTTAALFSAPTALQWKYKDDRNDEFWGHQTFIGENPPIEATISFFVKQLGDTLRDTVQLRIASAAQDGRVVRTLTVPNSRRGAGVQTVCWDLRVDPIVGAPAPAAPTAPPGGAGGEGGPGMATGAQPRARPIEGMPVPLPEAGYKPFNPCAPDGPRQGGGGFGGFGAQTGLGPYVAPGEYTVELLSQRKVLSSTTMRVIMDPAVQLAGAERAQYDALLLDLHAAQQRGTDMARELNALGQRIGAARARIDSIPAFAEEWRDRVNDIERAFDSVRVAFGVAAARRPSATAATAAPAAAPAGGGGGMFAAMNPANALGRVGSVKAQIGGIWETASEASVRDARASREALDGAIARARLLLERSALVQPLTP